MATESLIVELDAKTQKLDAKLKATDDRLKDLEQSTRNADITLAKMAKSAVKVGTALLAAASAVSAFVIANAKSVKELELLSRQTKLTVEDFKSLSFATKQYGINADQIADISKDLSDKLGEFSKVGTGAFQDFVDVVGLTKEEGQQLARFFENLSSEQVLGKMVSMMEQSGASANQMTFVMESMGNESSRLIPLFKNQSAELDKLRGQYDKINESMEITEEQQKALTELSTDWDLLTTALGNSATAISATLAPVLNDFINDVIKIVPNATQAIIDLFNTFKSAENINSIDAIDRQIASLNEQIEKVPESVKKAKMTGGGLLGFSSESLAEAQGRDPVQERVDKLKERIKELQEQRERLESESNKIADATKYKGGQIGGNLSENETEGDGNGFGIDFVGILDRQKSTHEQFLESQASFNELLTEINQGAADAEVLIQKEKSDKIRKQWEDDAKRKRELADFIAKYELQSTTRSGARLLSAISKVSKEGSIIQETAAKASIVASTAAGMMRQYQDLPYPASLIAASAIALEGVAAYNSVGSGSPSSGGSIAAASSAAPVPQEQPLESATVSVSEVDTGVGSSVTIMLDDGTDLATGMLERQDILDSDGRGDLF